MPQTLGAFVAARFRPPNRAASLPRRGEVVNSMQLNYRFDEEGYFEGTGLTVQPEWLDFNGHMNVAYYILAFAQVVDGVFDLLGVDADYRAARKHSMFALESHVTWQRELHLNDPLRITVQFLAADDKRLQSFYRMYHATKGYLAATSEWLQICVNLEARRSAHWDPQIRTRIDQALARQAHLPRAPETGRVIQVKKQAV